MHFGIVKSVSDPLKLGRVQVKVYDLHDKIKTEDLSWSQVIMPANTPAINGTGQSVNLAVGSLVAGIFLDGMMQEFMVMGSLPTKTDFTTDDNTDIGGSEAETTNEPDNNARVRAEVDPTADDIKGTYEPASAYAPIYPYNNVYETESGHVKEYDDTPGAERIKERHKSGTQYEIQPNGSKIEKIVRDNYQLVVGHDTLEVRGNVKIIVSGDANVAVAKNLTAQVGQDMTTIVGGNMITTVDGNADLLVKGDIDGEVRGSILFDVGEGKPEHVIHKDGLEVHHHDLDGYTKHQAITQWFPPVKTDTFTLTYRNMRTVKEMTTEEQAPYASALASFADYDASKVALVNGMWTYPNKTSYTAEYGVIELHTEGKLKAVIGGETDITALQSAKVTALDNITIAATGDESIIDINSIGTSSKIDINSAGTLELFSTGTADIESTGDMTLKSTNIKLDGNVVVTGTTKTSNTQLIDGHTHTQPDTAATATSQGNTGALS